MALPLRLSRRLRRYLGRLLLGAAALSGPPLLAQNAPADPAPQTAPLAAVERLIGNTLVYRPSAAPKGERGVFLRPDGTGLAAQTGQRPAEPVGWAMLSGGGFCLFAPGQDPNAGTCGRLELTAEQEARLTPEGAPPLALRLQEGDAWGLDPELAGRAPEQGAAAIARLAGQTLTLQPLGSPGPESQAFLFLADGRLRRAAPVPPEGAVWQGLPEERWTLRPADGALCLQAPGGPESCFAVTVQGRMVALRSEATGRRIFGQLHAGDARHLSPEAEAEAQALGRQLEGHSLLLAAAGRGATKDSILYFQPGGTGLAQTGGGTPEVIGWSVWPGGTLCLTPAPHERPARECVTLRLRDGLAELSAPGRPTIHAPLVAGNAQAQ